MITRFAHSICRYDEEAVICCVFQVMGLELPPARKARACADEMLRAGGFFEMLLASVPYRDDLEAHRVNISEILKLLDAPAIVPTSDDVHGATLLGRTVFVVSRATFTGVEVHAGVGAIFFEKSGDTLTSTVAPITGSGMESRRDYLVSVVEATRAKLEELFS